MDRTLSLVAFIGLSVPEVLSGLLLLMLAAHTGWFPVGGMRSLDWEIAAARGPGAGRAAAPRAARRWSWGSCRSPSRMRQMRCQPARRAAPRVRHDRPGEGPRRAHGGDEARAEERLNPLITLFGYTLGSLLSGSLVAEIVFSWPGLGRVTYEAILSRDQYLVVGSVLMAAVVLVLGNLVADLLLAAADPRIRHE